LGGFDLPGTGSANWIYNDSRPRKALAYQIPVAVWAAGMSPVDLPLRLDASPTTPQGPTTA